MEDERIVTMCVFNMPPRQTAEVAFLSAKAGQFEYSILSLTDVVPAFTKRRVASEPFLLQVIERDCVHIAAKLIAKSAGCNQILDPLAVVASGDDVFSGGRITGNEGNVWKRNLFHAMSAVATSVVLRFSQKTNISHRLSPCKRALSLL